MPGGQVHKSHEVSPHLIINTDIESTELDVHSESREGS